MIKKNIEYAQHSKNKNVLDVIYPAGKKDLPVIFFIHGGSWMSGSKDMYTKLAENFMDKGFVSVVTGYRLFPSTDVFGMASDCIDAFKWSKENIKSFGGDPKRIFLAGHSAGGHLAAVTGLREHNPREHVAGFILIDAFGLCAHYFLSEHHYSIPDFFAGIFGKEKNKWDNVSPDKLLREDLPPFLVLTGGSTYPYISYDSEKFMSLLDKFHVDHEHIIIPSKTHMQMIYEFEHSSANVYSHILDWIEKKRKK